MQTVSRRAGRLAAASCLVALCGAGPVEAAASAQSADTDTRSVRVKLQGIDLASPSGRALAGQRIDVAVRAACDVAGIAGVQVSADAARCLETALDDAAARLQALAVAMPASYAVAARSAAR